jgi:large subunit ribosomal protein L3
MTRIVTTKKLGPNRLETDAAEAVTVLEAPALMVAGLRTYLDSNDGLKVHDTVITENPSKDLNRKTSLPKKAAPARIDKIGEQAEKFADVRLLVHTQPRNTALGKKKPELFEVSLGGSDSKAKLEYAKQKLGKELKIEEVFREGELIDAKSVTKGKGFQGPVKRFGVTIRPRKHEKKRRHIGNIGSTGVGRVLPGKIAMPGQLGYQTRTEFNKRIMKIGSDGLNIEGGWLKYGHVKGQYVLLRGSVPGPKKRLIMLRKASRAEIREAPVEVKKVYTYSQQ